MNGPNFDRIIAETYWGIVAKAQGVEDAANGSRQQARFSNEAAEDNERLARQWRRTADQLAEMYGRVPPRLSEFEETTSS